MVLWARLLSCIKKQETCRREKTKGKKEKQKRGLHSFGIKDEKQIFFFFFFFNMSVFCNGIFLLNGLESCGKIVYKSTTKKKFIF